MSDTALPRYRVVFQGETVQGHDVKQVQQALAKLFRADLATVQRLFTGRPVALKEGLDAEEAIHFVSVLSQAGAVGRMEPVASGTPKSKRVSFLERRERQRREQLDRRKRLRSDAYVPDRRHGKGRREPEPD